MTGYQGHSLLALPLSARGDLSGSDAVIWSKDRATPYTPSPLLYDGLLFFNRSNQAILSCLNAKTGESLFGPVRLTGIANIYGSPVARTDAFTSRDEAEQP